MSETVYASNSTALVIWKPPRGLLATLARLPPVVIVAGVGLTTLAALSLLAPLSHGGGETARLPNGSDTVARDTPKPSILLDKPAVALPREPDATGAITAAAAPAVEAPSAKAFVAAAPAASVPAPAPSPAAVALLPLPIPLPMPAAAPVSAAPVRVAPVIEQPRAPVAARSAPARAMVASRGVETMRAPMRPAVPSMARGFAPLQHAFTSLMRAPFSHGVGAVFGGGRMAGGFGRRLPNFNPFRR